jgi:hypothetical protein
LRSNALYFPYINVPENAWFTRVLLYWDKVSSIVPAQYVRAPEQFDPYMRELVAAELVEQVFPAAYIGGGEFQTPFLRYVDNRRRSHVRNTRYIAHAAPTRLHIEKLGNIGEELVRRGLAECLDYPWYHVERWVATAFMAYLATLLGQQPGVSAAPVTNDLGSFRLLEGNRFPQLAPRIRSSARSFILRGLFPVPNDPIPVRDLVDFKARHGALLPPLRERVEQICKEVARIADAEVRQERLERARSELEESIELIAEVMRGRWRAVALHSLSVVSTGITLAVEADEGLGKLVAGGTGLAVAIGSALDSSKQYKMLTGGPLAYGARWRSRFDASQ